MTATGVGQAEYLPFAYPRSAAWHQQRREGIGGSEASTILGLNPYDNVLDLWRLKVGQDQPEDRPESEAMEWGRLLEDVVADKLEAVLQDEESIDLYLRHPDGTLFHPDRPWMRANVDRLVMSESHAHAVAVAEIKTVGLRGSGDWIGENGGSDGIATHALLQAVHYMAVTGLPLTYFGCLVAGQEFRWRKLERDEELEADLIKAEEAFWKCVQDQTPPTLPANDLNPEGTKAALNRLWSLTDPLTTAELAADMAETIEAYKALDGSIKGAERERDALGNRIREALADKEVGILDGREVVSWKTQSRKALNQRALRDEMPEIAEKFTTTTSTRVLRVK